jgi:outer membrane protein TolC
MNTPLWWFACIIAGTAAAGTSWAQPTNAPQETPRLQAAASQAASAPVTLRVALDAAWQRAVAAHESEGQRQRAEAESIAPQDWWAAAPSVSLSQRDDRLQSHTGRRETEIGLAVPLWLPGQRRARIDAAEAAVTQAALDATAARLRLAGELREIAGSWASLQAELTQAEAHARALRQLEDDVSRRVAAGDLARADALAAQAERLSAAVALSEARQQLEAVRAKWVLATGLTAVPALEMDTPDSPGGQEHPALRAAGQAVELARRRVEVARHSRREAPELSLGARQERGGFGESTQGSIVVGVRVPFGLDGRNRPMEAGALAELGIALTHEQRLRERLASDAAVAREALRAAQAQHAAATERAQALRERARLVDHSFRAGEMPLPELLRALAAAADADAALNRHAAARGLARARLDQSLGLLP